MKMHQMAISFSGDAAVDFVRGMILTTVGRSICAEF